MTMKTYLISAIALFAQIAFAQNVMIGTKNTTTKDAGIATFANSTFCLKEPSGADKACVNAPALSGDIVITVPAVTSTLATIDGTETLTNKTINGSQIVVNSLSLSKLTSVATATFLGRTSSGAGDVESLSATPATALLNSFVG